MSADSTQATERYQLLTLLENSERKYLGTLEGISDEAAQARLNEGSWSILEIAEHVAASEHGMFRLLELGHEKTTPPNFEVDATIRVVALDRTNKRQAPQGSQPKGRWKTLAEAVEAFRLSRARTREMARDAADLRKRGGQHPLVGELDGYQMLLLMALHAARHAAQIEEIKQERLAKAR
jgi:uncharacterized damage-inducible protein DinB